MRHYIKSIVTTAMLGLTIVSCNDDFDEDFHYSHPSNIEIGSWADDGMGQKSYSVNFAKAENGKTLCDIIETIPSVGITNVYANGETTYNANSGLIHVEFPKSPYNDKVGATAELSLLKDNKTLVGKTYVMTEKGLESKSSLSLTACDSLKICGNFAFNEKDSIAILSSGDVELNVNGKKVKGMSQQMGNTMSIATETGEALTVKLNANGQIVLVENGQEVALNRVVETKDDWYMLAIGTFNSWLFRASQKALFYSPSRHEAYIDNFVEKGTKFSFYWMIGRQTVIPTADLFATGYVHYQDGQKFGDVYAQPVPITQEGDVALFDASGNGLFYFGNAYVIPEIGAGFGADIETFEITQLAE